MSGHDQATRQRLIEAAAPLFATRGFKKVTVREICRAAEANIAAINYHFRDKRGLYREVLRMAVAVMQETTAAAQRVPARGPEEKLRAYVRIFLHRLLGGGRDVWLHRLIHRELVDPTSAVDALEIIVEQAMRPRVEFLASLVARMIGCPQGDRRVFQCVICIQGQCVMTLPNAILDRLRPGWTPSAREIERLADHIAAFSLAGIRAVARARPQSKGRRSRRPRAGWSSSRLDLQDLH